MHDFSLGGNSGQQHTYRIVKQKFYWPGVKSNVKEMVRNCAVYIQNKVDNTTYAGLRQPLPIPTQLWREISMDFIEGLPKSEGNDLILVVIGSFSKYGHFIALIHPYTAKKVAHAFFDTIYRLHGYRRL